MNLTSTTTFADLLTTLDGSGNTPEAVETTNWSQNQNSYSGVSFDQGSTAQEWLYIAQGRTSPITVSEAISTLTHEECFCDHSAIPADFSNLEAIDLGYWRNQMDGIAHEFGEEFRKIFLAIANNLAYHWGNCTQALTRGETGRLVVDKEIARQVIHAPALMKCALTSIRDYLDEHWGLNVARTTLTRWIKDKLSGLGIMHWWGVVADGKKPRHWSVNMPAMLLLAEACERRILADARMAGAIDGEEMEVLPEHRGYGLALLFDAVFPGFGWNREGAPEDPEPQTYAATDAYRAAKPEPERPVEASTYATEADEQRLALSQLKLAVKCRGWVDCVIEVCEMFAARWGPSWGLESLYERIAGEVSA